MEGPWHPIDRDVVFQARKIRKKWSYETLGRHLNVSGKAAERYEKTGRWPRELVPRLWRRY